ncbi:oxamate carbamoyltransferase subunit AllH family protein, partial [Actinacidiphila rubida]
TDWAGRGLLAGQAAVFAPGSITLAVPGRPVRLTTAGARGWSAAAPSVAGLRPGARATAADLLDRCNAEHGVRGGMLGATPGAGPMEAAIVRALHHGRTLLLDAIRAGDAGLMRQGVLALLGLGPGLTPAGDDFLTGLCLVAALPGSAQASLVPVVRDLASARPERTTDLSLATLLEAADARARAELLDILRLVAHTAAPGELHAAARALLAIGHTSGSDTLSGLAAGLRLEEELRGPL